MENYLYPQFKETIVELSESQDGEMLMEAYGCTADMLLLIEKGLPKDFVIGGLTAVSMDENMDVEQEKSFWTRLQQKIAEGLKQKGVAIGYAVTPLILQEEAKGQLDDFTYFGLLDNIDMAQEFGLPDVAEIFQNEINKRYPYTHLSNDEITNLMIDTDDPEARQEMQDELNSRNCYIYSAFKNMHLNDESWREQSLEELQEREFILANMLDFFMDEESPINKGEMIDFQEACLLYFDQKVDVYTESLLWLGALHDVHILLKEKFGVELPAIDKADISEEELHAMPVEELNFLFEAFSYRPDIYHEELVKISNLLNE